MKVQHGARPVGLRSRLVRIASAPSHRCQTVICQTRLSQNPLSVFFVISRHGGGGNRLGFWTLVTRSECSLFRHCSLTPRVARTLDVLSSFRRVGCDWFPSGSSRPSAAHASTPDTSRGLKWIFPPPQWIRGTGCGQSCTPLVCFSWPWTVQLSWVSSAFACFRMLSSDTSAIRFCLYLRFVRSAGSEVENHLDMGRDFLARGQLQDALSHYHAAVGKYPLIPSYGLTEFWTSVV